MLYYVVSAGVSPNVLSKLSGFALSLDVSANTSRAQRRFFRELLAAMARISRSSRKNFEERRVTVVPVNLLPRTSRIFFSQNCNIFSVLGITQAKQMINLSLLDNFYPVTSYRRVRKKKKETKLLYTVLVTRYGPQSVAQRKGLTRYTQRRCQYSQRLYDADGY